MQIDIHRKVRGLARCLEEQPMPGFREVVPGFASVTVFYDPLLISYRQAMQQLQDRLAHLSAASVDCPREVTIPVCYGGVFGPDLAEVAKLNSLTPEEVVAIHANETYTVYMIGFAPGFPYLGGMPERIATPRRATPRLSIPVGSVGIGGSQTGVYPLESPGGWQLIGRTPLALFDPQRAEPSLLRAGDLVRFQPISEQEYEKWGETT
ncbi:5-oxoprolinase subunit PxpB [Ectobacillus sp. SYSU M60031]|uniref:5-oxoprolinase subunit PxpB n=2 Tax=Ectobacillus ponti TaxID=2961894 RepID=A0AA41XBL9_9BACI|nr:5-oxoprolinase subunit PxpB [Ectobacillus ponti]